MDGVGTAGELVEQQLAPGILQHDVDVDQPGVELLGHDLGDRRRDALTDLGARKPDHHAARGGSRTQATCPARWTWTSSPS
jgi:hypothetical protein